MSDTPSIAELIRANATKITDSIELFELIQQHHPNATPQQVAAELRRQSAADAVEADELDIYRQRRPAND